jgi:hypothetical protein
MQQKAAGIALDLRLAIALTTGATYSGDRSVILLTVRWFAAPAK